MLAEHVPYSELPPRYHRWKWQVLLAFSGFYLFVYLGRFNIWPAAPLIKEQLQLSHFEIGLVTALMLWGFGLGDLVHGRLAESYGMRLWVLVGAILTTLFNWITSFGTSALTLMVPWGINGFVNAACWSPGIGLLSQWWPRRDRGKALGIYGIAAGGAMLVMWLVTGWTVDQYGWRAAFRYPPLLITALGIAFYLLSRDRPSEIGLPSYVEEDSLSADAEAASQGRMGGLGPYKQLLSNYQFQLASHVKGLENVARYGLTTWVPIYYFEQAGLDIKSTVLVTMGLPLGYLLAPFVAGFISDRFLRSARRPMVLISCGISAVALVVIALVPATSLLLGAIFLLIAGFAMSLSPMAALAVDIAGRHMAGTASGVLDAHGYFYAGLQAIIFSIMLDMTGSPWPLVFLGMALSRLVAAAMISFVKV